MSGWSWLHFDSALVKLKKGELLFDQGSPIQRMHVISSGRVKLIRHSADGEDVVLHVATAGELVAEASFFSSHYHCRAIADQPAVIKTINRDKALALILSQPQTSEAVMQLFAQQIRDLRGLVEMRNIRSADARILAYLESLADADGQIKLAMSLRDMAYKLGLAHETLYRALRRLEEDGKLKRPTSGYLVLQ